MMPSPCAGCLACSPAPEFAAWLESQDCQRARVHSNSTTRREAQVSSWSATVLAQSERIDLMPDADKPDPTERATATTSGGCRDGLFPGAGPAIGNVLEFRVVVLDHLHSGRWSHFVSPGLLQCGRCIDRARLAAGGLFALAVAATMGQLASAFPTAGGLYHWASLLGGRGWGWATAWFNLAGLVTVLAAINVGTYRFAVGVILFPAGLASEFDLPAQALGVVLITATQATINHLGIGLTARLTDFSGYWILLVAAVLTASLLAFAPGLDLSRLVTFENFSGPAGGNVWPRNTGHGATLCSGIALARVHHHRFRCLGSRRRGDDRRHRERARGIRAFGSGLRRGGLAFAGRGRTGCARPYPRPPHEAKGLSWRS